ncbi:MAG TPA: hypothetical protein PK995_09895 [Bacteroidia bacterium]|nr:hypothetical protein [Bacteroidia bacterium]
MRKVSLIFVSIILIIISCNNEPIENKKLNGLSEDEVVKIFGKPDTILIFKLSEAKMYEYRMNLPIIFSEYNKDTIHIKEIMWKNRENNIVIWLIKRNGKWISIDNVIWDNDKVTF